ncbi:MAG TPA: hypothetical protein PLY70_06870 [Saprospiraceae bacterium]|nr:hypothetical protein [Saprospiraceae bacterium]HPN71299.1 hypothetical protein [Saprospiraceae bacterium]
MKNIIAKIIGFISGVSLWTLLFYYVIARLPIFDDDSPGIYVISTLAFGIIFAALGSQLQNKYFGIKSKIL